MDFYTASLGCSTHVYLKEMEMPELFEFFVKSLSRENATTPLVIVTGTLLALISLRAGHLAERIRQNVKEALKNNVVDSRFASLKKQNRIFTRRYKWTCGAFILFALALVSISIAGLLVFMEQPGSPDLM